MHINRTGAMRRRWLFFGATTFFGTMTFFGAMKLCETAPVAPPPQWA
jgi:hypothetical protein